MGDVVAHERTVIAHSVFQHQVDHFIGDVLDEGAIAIRRLAADAIVRIQRPLERLAFVAIGCNRVFVDPALVANLVPALQDRFDRVPVLFKAPAGDEKRLFQAKVFVGVQDAGQRQIGPIPSHANRIEPAVANPIEL